MSGILNRSLVLAASLLWFAAAASAQTNYGTIRGAVLDSSGAAHPNVAIAATNIETGVTQSVTSNDVGNYVVPNLISGSYRVTAAQAGFKRFVAGPVELAAAQDVRVDVRMEVGVVTDSITVVGGAPLIETERATLSEAKTQYIFQNVPINANYRSIWRLLTLTPGVVSGANSIAGNSKGSNSTFNIDGVPMIDGWSGNSVGPAFTFLDGYREYRTDFASANASTGTTATVSVISENGTNQWHGEGWLHYNAIGFVARPFFAPTRPSGPPMFRPNVKFGGPLRLGRLYDGRNRSFFHFTYQGLRGSQLPQVSNFVVPSAPFREGDFSSLSKTLTDPLNGQPFSGSRIPASRLSGVSRYFQDTFYPAPNSGADRFKNIAVFPNRDDQYVGRLDHQISNANSIFGRVMFHHYAFQNYQDSNPQVGVYKQYRDQFNIVLSDTHTFSASLYNELRFGWGSDDSAYNGPRRGLDVVKASGLQLGDLVDVYAMPAMSITGYQRLGQADQGGWTWSNYYLVESLRYNRGRHNLQFGADWAKMNGTLIPTSPSAVFGSYTFNGRFSGDPYADFLLGMMDGSARATSVSPVYRHRNNWAFHFTDSFKVTPRLSLDFGLRYSLLDPGYTERGLFANFNPARNALVVPDQAAMGRIHPGFPKNVPVLTAAAAGVGAKLVNWDRNNLAPRLGFAWRPTKRDDFVVRGAAGIYYVALQPNPSDGGGLPFELNESFTNTLANGVPGFAFPRPFPTTVYQLGGSNGAGMNPNLRTPYTIQYNFTLEKQVLDMGVSLSYVSTLGRKNTWSRNLNQPVADLRPYAEKFALRPFSYFGSASYTDNGASHSYHALMAKAERRLKGGFFYSTNLTWAKSMGDDWANPEDVFNRSRERSQGGQIPRLRAVATGLYELPLGHGRKFAASSPRLLDALIGGWTVSGTWVAQTGLYFAPSFSGTDPSNTENRRGRADRIAGGNLPASQRSVERWFDTAAFVTPANGIGRFGTSGDAVLEGPGLNVFHFGLGKDIAIYERVKMRLEAASTDFFNHPNFSNPSAVVGTSTFGRVLGTVGDDGNRNFQFTVRLVF